jgi:hypothetical protein
MFAPRSFKPYPRSALKGSTNVTCRTLVLSLVSLWFTVAGPVFGQQARDAGTWAFTHSPDRFDATAALDLRFLNEREAGESGFLRCAPDGKGFVLGNGKPVRLWAVGSDLFAKSSPAEMARHARFLAKLGVNMVRIHTQLNPGTKGSRLTDVDVSLIDRIWRFVAALKKEGIYVTISPYWATSRDVTHWGLDGLTGQSDLWGLLFFDEQLQKGYEAWARALYAPPNPYTGKPLARDPAVGIIQVQNEDSLLFWTTQGLKPALQEHLGRKFGQWLVQKYGSLQKARAAWKGTKHEGDDFARGKVGLYKAWHLTQDWEGGTAQRVNDEHQFYAQTQRHFYENMAKFYRQELGCRQLLNACNWVTADPIRLNDTERWTYAAMDVLAVNKYTGGVHVGENNGWRIDPGHYFTNQSCLTEPRTLPVNLKQVVGHPMIITESTWVHPEGYQTEGPFLVAAYESLTGVAGFYWFAATAVEYDLDPTLPFLNLNGQHPLFKWSCSTPSLMAQFPAAALLYRQSCLRSAPPVIHEERSMADMWQRKVPLIAEDRSFDPNRYQGTAGEKSSLRGGADPLAFLVGRVEVKYGGDPARTEIAELGNYIDTKRKTVRSVTGEIQLDYGIGVCTVNAPRAQGASGFLSKAGPIRLADLTIRSGNDYATIYAISLDGRPLRDSAKILVQVGTSARLSGWKTKEALFNGDRQQKLHGYEILATGHAPWRVVNTDVTLRLQNARIQRATLLDTGGYGVQKTKCSREGDMLVLKLPANALYVVLD